MKAGSVSLFDGSGIESSYRYSRIVPSLWSHVPICVISSMSLIIEGTRKLMWKSGVVACEEGRASPIWVRRAAKQEELRLSCQAIFRIPIALAPLPVVCIWWHTQLVTVLSLLSVNQHHSLCLDIRNDFVHWNWIHEGLVFSNKPRMLQSLSSGRSFDWVKYQALFDKWAHFFWEIRKYFVDFRQDADLILLH